MKFTQIKNIKEVNYKGEVYDLRVDNSASYNIDDLIVHNSGAGSLVLYTLGITDADPIEYDLLFERFLNQDRGHIPDIDVDFDTKLGPMVFKHINEKYGNEYCSNIITFLRMQPKVIITDVARCFNIPLQEVKDYTTHLPDTIDGQEITFDALFKHKQYGQFFNKYPELKKFVKYYEGLPRGTGQHAAGIGIASIPIKDVSPVILSKDGDTDLMYLSTFEKEDYEHYGLIKFDILKLSNIRQVRDVLTMANKIYNTNLTEKDIPLDDPKTWALINKSKTEGVFQFGDVLGKEVIKKVHPDNIEELAACNAFIRPGASGVDNYVNGKKGFNTVKYDERIDKILEKTYGSIVFQEQIMALISELIGVSFGKADIYRRALEKPKKGKNAKLIEQFNNDVKTKAVERGYKPEVAEAIRKLIIDNSGYGFNKCLSGEEILYGRTLTIKELFNKKEYGRAYSIKTTKNKYDAIKNDIIDITYSGYLDTYTVVTNNGSSVRCTLNHKFPTPNGYKTLSQLAIGDLIYTYQNNKIIDDEITDIIYYGKEDTYNVEMKHPYHTIIMNNGVVVSNSHAVCYSIISYQTAWCKANYPDIFYAVMINSCSDAKVAVYLNEAKQLGINILPPDVNKSGMESTVENGNIRIGLNVLKGIGPAVAEAIVNNRPYNTLEEVFNSKVFNSKAIEVCTNTSAFSELPISNNINKTLSPIQIEKLFELASDTSKVSSNYAVPFSKIKSVYINSYDFIQEKDRTVIMPLSCLSEFNIDITKCKPTNAQPKGFLAQKTGGTFDYVYNNNKEFIDNLSESKIQLYTRSFEYITFPIFKHPCFELQQVCDKNNRGKLYFEEFEDNELIEIAGIVIDTETKTTKTKSLYYIVHLNTPREIIALQLWDNVYNKYQPYLQKNDVIVVQGTKGFNRLSVLQIKTPPKNG